MARRMRVPHGREVVVIPNMGGPTGRARPRTGSTVGPGLSWSVWQVPPFRPRLGAAAMTAARQDKLERYRRETGQEPFDVVRAWPDRDIKPDNTTDIE